MNTMKCVHCANPAITTFRNWDERLAKVDGGLCADHILNVRTVHTPRPDGSAVSVGNPFGANHGKITTGWGPGTPPELLAEMKAVIAATEGRYRQCDSCGNTIHKDHTVASRV